MPKVIVIEETWNAYGKGSARIAEIEQDKAVAYERAGNLDVYRTICPSMVKAREALRVAQAAIEEV